MAKINLETEPRFKALMKELGFKKERQFFVREYNDTKQSLGFAYSTYGLKDTRFYSLTYYIDCLPILELKKKTDISISPIGDIIFLKMGIFHQEIIFSDEYNNR